MGRNKNREPQFSLEPSGLDGSFYLLSRKGLVIGLLKDNGTLDKTEARKRYYLSKLNLKPIKPKTNQEH